jgi:cyclohexyl-isocyanide hydratase
VDADEPLAIGLLLFPGRTQLDLTGPYEVFARAPGARVHLKRRNRSFIRYLGAE